MNPAISVIVPVYNTEKYLDECILSILNQSFTDFELLLIDDGSTDRSGAICDQYAAKDERVRVFHKKNGGVSSARNVGLDEAKGEYVIFLDADDYWYRDDCLEALLRIAVQTKVDVVRGEYKAVDENGNFVFSRSVSKKRMQYVDRPINTLEFLKYAVNDEFFSWLLLFRRELVSKLRFEVGRIYLEDMMFISEIMIKEDVRCMYVPDVRFYAYRKHRASISYQINSKKISDALGICDFFHDLSYKTENVSLQKYFQQTSIKRYYTTLQIFSCDMYYTNIHVYIDEFKLRKRKKMLFRWMYEYDMYFYPITYYLPLLWSIRLFRYRLKLGFYKRKYIQLMHNFYVTERNA